MVRQKTHKPKKTKVETVYQPIRNDNIKSETNDTSFALIPVDKGKLSVIADTSTEDLKATLDSMMERVDYGDYKWKCNVCGKKSARKDHTRSHVQTHIEGLSYPCNHCDKVSRSTSALAVHNSSYHRK